MKRGITILTLASFGAAVVFSGCGRNSEGMLDIQTLLDSTDYDVTEYVTLNDYMNMTVELDSSYEVTEDQVESYINTLIYTYPDYEESDKTVVENGDVVNIDFEGRIDGETFDGGSSDNYVLEIGSGSFIDGFEDGLIGVNTGETVDLDLTFPDDYSTTSLAGEDVVFTVTVNSIGSKISMTYDDLYDEYVEKNLYSVYGVSTVDEFYAYVQGTIEDYNNYNEYMEIQTKVVDMLLEECTVEFPEGFIEQQKEYYTSYADELGMEFDEFLSDQMSMTNEEFDAYIEDTAKEELILEAIVADSDIELTESGYQEFVEEIMDYYDIETEEEFYDFYGEEDYVKLGYAETRALEMIINNIQSAIDESAK